MAKVARDINTYGYKWSGKLTIPLAGTLVVATLTPEDADLHDLTREGLRITRIETSFDMINSNGGFSIAVFNKTSSNDPIVNYDKAAWKDTLQGISSGAAWLTYERSRLIDLTSMPGGGIPLVGDFITLTGKFNAALASNTIVEYKIFYAWITMNPDEYRSLLYARSI